MSQVKTVLFRADSSSKIGTGHIMRDLVLAKKYAKKGVRVLFATRNLEGNINQKIVDAGYEIFLLQSNGKKELVQLLKNLRVDLLVIDHYGIGYQKERYIKQKTQVKILSFDDTYKRHYCDILLNHNVGANKHKYKKLVPKKCKIQCGKKYTLLRDEFYEQKSKKYKKNKKKKRVFLAMGGADTAKLNCKILDVLMKFKELRVSVVTTDANPNLQKLKQYVKNKKQIELHINSTKIAKLMAKSDFAIVTPSVVLNEVFFMKLPFIAIQTADNQKDIYQYLQKKDYDVMDSFDEEKLEFFLFLHLYDYRMKNFTSLDKKDKKILLQWRNEKRVRKWMYSKDKILLKHHLAYINSLKQKDDRIYFLVEHNFQKIGVIDLTNIKNKSAEIGLYANPNLYGVGAILMQLIIRYGFLYLKLKLLKANVYTNNIKALNLYKKFGFLIHHEKEGLYYMRLKRKDANV